MDKKSENNPGHSIVVTGVGHEASPDVLIRLEQRRQEISKAQLFHDCSPVEYLRHRKTLKYMSKQDRLALTAAGKALSHSGAEGEDLQWRLGVFMTMGYIPFRREEAERICTYAQQEGLFSMKKFSTEAYDRINPLLAFSCLPNMPAHHLSSNFDLKGEYFLTYPGTPELYLSLAEAVARLQSGDMAWALVGGVADQANFLVQNHYAKHFPGKTVYAADAAAFMILEREDHATARDKRPAMGLLSLDTVCCPETNRPSEISTGLALGPADLPLNLSLAIARGQDVYEHIHQAEHHLFKSRWGRL